MRAWQILLGGLLIMAVCGAHENDRPIPPTEVLG
jgi:hypothetical protein